MVILSLMSPRIDRDLSCLGETERGSKQGLSLDKCVVVTYQDRHLLKITTRFVNIFCYTYEILKGEN